MLLAAVAKPTARPRRGLLTRVGSWRASVVILLTFPFMAAWRKRLPKLNVARACRMATEAMADIVAGVLPFCRARLEEGMRGGENAVKIADPSTPHLVPGVRVGAVLEKQKTHVLVAFVSRLVQWRLLDLGKEEEGDDQVGRGVFLALSSCWGRRQTEHVGSTSAMRWLRSHSAT